VSFFYEVLSDSKYFSFESLEGYYDFGARIENEVKLSDGFALRFGIDYLAEAAF
jgi:hypothetical protein